MRAKPILEVFSDGEWHRYTDVQILPNRYVSVNGNEPTPIEDYGDYRLTWTT
ncbi:MAG: hypothetical protein GF334_04510 [Candidatus Altiarchaeales archaeon]|nr:hypothetical protein [Candidatus Altiarchaeales archaeon]